MTPGHHALALRAPTLELALQAIGSRVGSDCAEVNKSVSREPVRANTHNVVVGFSFLGVLRITVALLVMKAQMEVRACLELYILIIPALVVP